MNGPWALDNTGKEACEVQTPVGQCKHTGEAMQTMSEHARNSVQHITKELALHQRCCYTASGLKRQRGCQGPPGGHLVGTAVQRIHHCP